MWHLCLFKNGILRIASSFSCLTIKVCAGVSEVSWEAEGNPGPAPTPHKPFSPPILQSNFSVGKLKVSANLAVLTLLGACHFDKGGLLTLPGLGFCLGLRGVN